MIKKKHVNVSEIRQKCVAEDYAYKMMLLLHGLESYLLADINMQFPL